MLVPFLIFLACIAILQFLNPMDFVSAYCWPCVSPSHQICMLGELVSEVLGCADSNLNKVALGDYLHPV